MKVFISHKIRYNAMRLAKEGTPHSKSSLQYNLPKDIASDIINWSINNIPEEELYTEEEGMGREDSIHLTIFYGILDADPNKTIELLKDNKIQPFYIRLSALTTFHNKVEYDVLKIDVESSELHRIHNLIKDNLDTDSTYPDYYPHITLAYIKKGLSNKYCISGIFSGIKILVNKLEFSSKDGSKSCINL